MSLVLTLSDVSPTAWSAEIAPVPKVLGRADSADIRLDHRSVSRQHCRFWVENGGCYIEDAGSTNGTWVNGNRIKRRKLRRGDRILVGRFELLVADKQQLRQTDFEMPAHIQTEADMPARAASSDTLCLPVRRPEHDERRLAVEVHQRMIPTRRISVPGLMIEAAYRPSGHSGGDWFDCVDLEDRSLIAMLDPMTHGVKVALTLMLLRSELERWARIAHEPGSCMERINRELMSLGVSDLYVCACLALWLPRTKTLVYSSAGHHPPVLMRHAELLNRNRIATGLPLGVDAEEEFAEQMFQLEHGDRVFLFTDGLLTQWRATRKPQRLAPLLAEAFGQAGQKNLRTQVHTLLNNLGDPLLDDLLLVGCEVV